MRYGEEFEIVALPAGCEPWHWFPRGAVRQWRGPDGLHVRQYADGRLIAHYDRVDPRDNLIGHLVFDAPLETLVFTVLGALAIRALSKPTSG